jgi:hypothetical protein
MYIVDRANSLSNPNPDPNAVVRQSAGLLQFPVILEDSDIHGAVRLAASDDMAAPFGDVTAAAFAPNIPLVPHRRRRATTRARVNDLLESNILVAIKSSVLGQAVVPDGLRPRHLKDTTNASARDVGHRLMARLTEFTNLLSHGPRSYCCTPDLLWRLFLCSQRERWR